MNNIVVKKYTNALIEEFDKSELKDIIKNLELVTQAFKLNKFSAIVNSPVVAAQKKEELVFSLLENISDKFRNFLRILSQNKRLGLIPEILAGLKTKLASLNNEFIGKIYSKDEINNSQIKAMQDSLSKKFGANITLEYVKSEYNGIKVDLDELGVEISFSVDRLKQDMSEYILKAI
ncbi:F0F1 ATP synthase subunit delta [Campylobacter geochelonis]|uniref:ATP synthase subunit delta n=1 Tax=Campylobacter geochelonis TaxID=1780362 RepID=A0A128END5_9BACT|nr:F0F1 ATP synthase subunit delta [Campylobacter geochelonis]QKF70696.1 ATP synthase, F1 complex, delta subunit [Campylobacter geochelonis]CZE45768.1 F0F1 ATP synthase subunit delta [Campylobacter geochelonis]CZE46875.1 F0F1 ATP synthase subunit delta [Campylobacter geochelonis]CZE50259.1 F0F1 ATP synthase subunit delta [Campylobacter geochelonis]